MTHETKEKHGERSENEIFLGLAFSTWAWLNLQATKLFIVKSATKGVVVTTP